MRDHKLADVGVSREPAGVGAGEMHVRRMLVVLGKARLGEEQISVLGEACEFGERTRVGRVHKGFPPCGETNRMRLDGMHSADQLDLERSDHALGRVGECEDIVKLGRRVAEGSGYSTAFCDGSHDRQHPHLGVPLMSSYMRERDQIEPVIAVHVAQVQRVDLARVDEPLERAERSVAEVEHEAKPVMLDEVARARRIRSWMATGTTDYGQAHDGVRIASWSNTFDGLDLGAEESAAEFIERIGIAGRDERVSRRRCMF